MKEQLDHPFASLEDRPFTEFTPSTSSGQALERSEGLEDHREIDAFGKNVGEVWELNKTLDPGTSNEQIEAILRKISHLVHGAKLLGAGGRQFIINQRFIFLTTSGGFLFMVTKGISEIKHRNH